MTLRAGLRRLWFVVALTLAVSFEASEVPRSVASDTDLWQHLATEHFRVHYMSGERYATRVARVAEDTLTLVAERLTFQIDPPIDVWIADSATAFRSLAHAPIQDWARGYAFPEQHEIVLLRPTGAGRWHELERLTRHEVAHMCLAYMLGSASKGIPVWFHEGFAMYASETWTPQRQWVLLSGALFKRIAPLDTLSRGFPQDGAEAGLAYAQSFSAVRSLAVDHSFTQLRTLLDRLADGEPFDDAFRRSFGITVEMFDADWQTSATSGIQWLALLGGGLAFGAFFSPFLVMGYLRRRRARRRRLDAWEAEEAKPDRFFAD